MINFLVEETFSWKNDMAGKDYYKALGVGKGADQEEIQKAYRRLAQMYHPDVNKGSGAEERFKEIAAAYEILGDPEKRRKYDDASASRHRPQGRPKHSADVEDIRSPRGTESDYFSVRFRDPFGGRGWGGRAPEDPTSGLRRSSRGEDRHATVDIPLRDAVKGGRLKVDLERMEYGMEGRSQRVRDTFLIDLRPGTAAGSVIEIPGQGRPGSAGGAPGNLYLKVHIIPDARFRIAGHDLEASAEITPWEAALGADITVPTLDGVATLTVPAGTQSGQTLRLAGEGLPFGDRRGDLMVQVRVVVPEKLTAEERELFEKLAEKSRFNPRQ